MGSQAPLGKQRKEVPALGLFEAFGQGLGEGREVLLAEALECTSDNHGFRFTDIGWAGELSLGLLLAE